MSNNRAGLAEEKIVDTKEIQELIKILEDSGLTEIEVEEEGRRIRLQKGQLLVAPQQIVQAAAAPEAPTPAQDEATSDAAEDPAGGMPTFDSPMVGTFYRSPAPDEDPFVKTGDKVEEDQTVCIVEAMKLMNEVGAKFSGEIEKILVENGEPVEFGQPLFAVRVLD